jgi:hypothetical protein
MKTLEDFSYHVGITTPASNQPSPQLVVIAICKECAFSMPFFDNDKAPMNAASYISQHVCYHRIVSVPK